MSMEVESVEFNWDKNLHYFTKGGRMRPRVGHRHQVQIPPMTSTCENIQLLKHPEDSEAAGKVLYSHATGLPIPDNKVNETDYVELLVDGSEFCSEEKLNHWSEAEEDSFLLGLYMYGKNFVKVKNFMENKHMGQILAFYYSTFYKSEKFCTWSSSCKKMKRVKKRSCTFARKIFKGRRLDQVLSRLQYSHNSDDLQATLLEVSLSFEGRKTSLEDFLSFLKETVGINVLVDAVGIGKRDFTIVENTNRVSPRFLPNGKALSSLTASDMVRYLSRSFLSNRAWCEDIFWEAVWPRLLARGWHSEEPINQGYVSHALVFLVPGIHKFSRRDLKKRDQYFDTIDDVLKKVLADPNLIELKSYNGRGPQGQTSDQVGVERSRINNAADDNNDPLKRHRLTTDGAIVNFSGEERKIEEDMCGYISIFDTPDPGTERQISAICIDLTHWQESPPRKLESQNNQSTPDRIVPRISDGTDTDVRASEQPPPVHTRRQSSRNRPLSIKALEALEAGLWDLPARITTTTTRSKERKPEIWSGQSRIKRSPTQTNTDNTDTANPKRAKRMNEAVVGNDTARQPLNTIQEHRLSNRQ